ncbi:MAG TPA: GIY-YIG nuclease family protein [Abditibacterium sp.]|jgi:putative endonuclease
MKERRFYVYIMANASKTLYIGMTNDLERRVQEHKSKTIKGFTQRYNISKLVYFGEFHDPRDAIEYEKQLKGWLRAKKIALIEAENSTWRDLSADWLSKT